MSMAELPEPVSTKYEDWEGRTRDMFIEETVEDLRQKFNDLVEYLKEREGE